MLNIIDLLNIAIKNNGYITKKDFLDALISPKLKTYEDKKNAILNFIFIVAGEADYLCAPLSYPITFQPTAKQRKFIDNTLDFDNEDCFFNLHYSLFYNKNNDIEYLKSVLKFFQSIKTLYIKDELTTKPSITLLPSLKDGFDIVSMIPEFDLSSIYGDEHVSFWFKKLRPIVDNKKIRAVMHITPESILDMSEYSVMIAPILKLMKENKKNSPKDDTENYVIIDL